MHDLILIYSLCFHSNCWLQMNKYHLQKQSCMWSTGLLNKKNIKNMISMTMNISNKLLNPSLWRNGNVIYVQMLYSILLANAQDISQLYHHINYSVSLTLWTHTYTSGCVCQWNIVYLMRNCSPCILHISGICGIAMLGQNDIKHRLCKILPSWNF